MFCSWLLMLIDNLGILWRPRMILRVLNNNSGKLFITFVKYYLFVIKQKGLFYYLLPLAAVTINNGET